MSVELRTAITIDQSDIGQPEGPYTPGNTQNDGWDHVIHTQVDPKKEKIVNDTPATDRPLLSELYPETQKRYMPELYKHMRSNLTYEELKKYQDLDAKTLISTLEQDGKIQIHGEGGKLLRDSLVRLTNGSKIFRQSLMVGLAADKKYDLYADTFDKLDQELKADGSSLDEQGHGINADSWLGFAPLDEFVLVDNNQVPSVKKSYNKIDGVFDIASIINKTDFTQELSQYESRYLDLAVAHEFGHLTLDLTDGFERDHLANMLYDDPYPRNPVFGYYDWTGVDDNPKGKVGPNQVYSHDVMIDMGYNDDTKRIGTYGEGENESRNPGLFQVGLVKDPSYYPDSEYYDAPLPFARKRTKEEEYGTQPDKKVETLTFGETKKSG